MPRFDVQFTGKLSSSQDLDQFEKTRRTRAVFISGCRAVLQTTNRLRRIAQQQIDQNFALGKRQDESRRKRTYVGRGVRFACGRRERERRVIVWASSAGACE
jgi:hypothetical protein